MKIKKFRQVRAVVFLFVLAIVSLSVLKDSYFLSSLGVFVGMLFLILVRSKTKIVVDEREKSIREKAAQLTYGIFVPTIGLGSFFLLLGASEEYFYLESLGMVLAYLTLFLISLYSISYYFLNRKYGGGRGEE